ncbi:AAA domain-containing protein [Tahibacter sp. UC22_41]|uniref:AAA domain-containing protein n=1 Tax=Tahibacter sp. UC22_41 TaxID=3350178 RepID=UPI0036DC35AB
MNLRPIWLMNPDVASRLLPLQAGLFDTVVYDEASQMPVEHALPTLFRGGGCVVSGDEKQMPPTAFFTSRIESDEAQDFDGEEPDEEATEQEIQAYDETWNRREIKDCPDLLQLARAALPNTSLQIHYRSAFRALIDYSNACFYANGLSVPVRHPNATIGRERPIEVIRADGVYRDQTNPGEAQQVVEVLDQLWCRPYAERPSVGVVTFNRKQADLIEECLEQRAETDADFRERYRQERERVDGEEDMGVFVKNVENVQGDERDVIVFSSTFGRNAQGTFRRAFGVLGQKGGERRLNVAVTRARRKIVMVTSMPTGEISDLLTTRRPPATPRDFLQAYMEYARALSAGEFETAAALLRRLAVGGSERRAAAAARSEDGLAASVAAYVESLGWKTTRTREDDAFRLDFAIEDPATGLFAIGIECDSPRHALLSSARAREVWRPGVLRRHVPALHRVSSQAWYHSPDTERERLRQAIERVLGKPVREVA